MNDTHKRQVAARDAFDTFQSLLNCSSVKPVYKCEEEDILTIMNKIDELMIQYGKVQ